MRIALLAPTHKSFTAKLLNIEDSSMLPEGYFGAPFLHDIIDGLLRKGHEVIAITTSFADNADFSVKTFQYQNFTWVVVPMRRHAFRFNKFKWGRMLDFYAIERRLILEQIKQYKPDLVHAHWGYEFAHCAIASQLPHLITLHDNPFVIIRFQKSLYRIFKLVYAVYLINKIKFSSTVSPYMLKYVSSKNKACRLIPNPVPISLKKDEVIKLIESRKNTLTTNPNFVMIINGWDSRKNGRNGLLAFKLIQKAFPGASLYLFGRGTEVGGKAYSDGEDLKLKNVFYYGITDRLQMISKLKEMHMLLHTALEESFGVVLIEAMSLGLPAIGGVESGAVPWVIANENLLTNVNNPLQIASTVKSCMESYERISLSCFENVATRFSVETVTNQYEKYYFDIIGS